MVYALAQMARLQPYKTLWELRAWRCVFSGTAVLLYVGDVEVASVFATGRKEVLSIAGKWQRAVEKIVSLERRP
jgi:hypothetical protein